MFGTIFNKNDALYRKEKLRLQASSVRTAADKANRQLTATEQGAYDSLLDQIKGINDELDTHEKGAHGGAKFESVFPMAESVPVHFTGMPGGNRNGSLRAALANATEEQREEINALAGFMTGQRDI